MRGWECDTLLSGFVGFFLSVLKVLCFLLEVPLQD